MNRRPSGVYRRMVIVGMAARMAWIESHQELGAHPKTRKLSRILGISRPTAVGHLQFFWWWAMDYAQDGDLSRFDALDIAIGGEWDGDSDAFIDALIRAGFVDRNGQQLLIHDWSEYAGRLIERRRQDADRKRKARDAREMSAGRPADATRTSGGRDADVREAAYVTQPNLTVPNPTEPTHTSRAPAHEEPPSEHENVCVLDSFDSFFAGYPASGRGAKVKARAAYVAALQSGATSDQIADGLDRWKACGQWQRGYVLNCADWLNDAKYGERPPRDPTPKRKTVEPLQSAHEYTAERNRQ